MNSQRSLCFPFVFLLFVALLSAGYAQATIDGFGVGKKADYLQTSSATPTSHVILGDPLGPYHFSADLSGTNLNLFSPAPKVTTPAALPYNLTGDSTEMGVVKDYASKSALDAAFPNGSYSFTVGVNTLPMSLGASDGYPVDIPRIINGTWDEQGRLVLGAWANNTLNFSAFSSYLTGFGGMIIFSISELSGNVVGTEKVYVDSTNIPGVINQSAVTSYVLSSGQLQPDRLYYAELSYIRLVNLNTDFALNLGAVGVAQFVNTTGMVISTGVKPGFLGGQPGNRTVTAGDHVYLPCSIVPTDPLPSFQWQRLPAGSNTWSDLSDSYPFGGTKTAELYIAFVTSSMNGDQFRMVATNQAGSATSPSGILTVLAGTAPIFTRQPESLVVNAGGTATFTANGYGTAPLTYQWYLNGQSLPGGTNNDLRIANVQQSNAGNYTVVVTNFLGSVTSNNATLTLVSSLGAVSVTGGGSSSFFLQSDGSLWAVGGNDYGQLGDGTYKDRANPVQVASGTVAVASGLAHTCIVQSDGTLWAWGSNESGQLGDGTVLNRISRFQVATGVVTVACGTNYTLFLKSDGSLWGMGQNYWGQLGDGTSDMHKVPVQLATGVASVFAGELHALFIKADGTLWAMGANFGGQLGDGTTDNQHTPKLIASGVVSASAGWAFSVFLKADGTLWGMGNNAAGQLGLGTNTDHLVPVLISSGVVSVAAGRYHCLFLKTNGAVFSTGHNNMGQLGDGTIMGRNLPFQIATDVASVKAGALHSLFIKLDGGLWSMGDNSHGQCGDGVSYIAGTSVSNPNPVRVWNGPLTSPAAPKDFRLTGETALNCLRFNWVPSLGAEKYEVWRNTINDSTTAMRVAGSVANALYFDSPVQSGVSYYYWIRAVNPAGAGAFSSVTECAPPSNVIISITVE